MNRSQAAGFAFLFLAFALSGCNPLAGDLDASYKGENYRPGYGSTDTGVFALDSLPSLLRGGQSVTLGFRIPASATAARLEFSDDDGATWSTIGALSLSDVAYVWTVPTTDTVLGRVRLSVTDPVLQPTEQMSPSFTVDSVAPAAPSIALTSANPTNSLGATLTTASCAGDRYAILVRESATAPSPDDSGWQICTTAAGTTTHALSAADGTKTLYAFAKDEAGNVSGASGVVSLALDRTAPTVSLTSFTGGQIVSGLSPTTQSVTWAASDSGGSNLKSGAAKIELSSDGGASWSVVASGQTTAGPYTWTPGALNGANYRVRVTVSDNAGNSSSAASGSGFTVDSTPPALTAGGMSLNGGTSGPTITTNLVTIALGASDALTKITHFCLKYGTTAKPDLTDPCWRAVNEPGIDLVPQATLSLANFEYLLGFASGGYTVAAWVRDEAKNISDLTSSGAGTNGRDVVSATYVKPTSVTISALLSVAAESPNAPLAASDTNLSGGAPLYVKWKSNIPSGNSIQSIRVEYLTNETTENWTDFGATGLVDGANGCTPDGAGNSDDGYTGCYKGAAPAGTYFRVRVLVTDQYGSVRVSAAAPNNTAPFEILAGNLDNSLEGDPRGVILNRSFAAQRGTQGTLAATNSGTVYFRDPVRGILRFSAANGKLEVLFPINTSSAAVSYSNALRSAVTLKNPSQIDVDSSGYLYILDQQFIHKWNPTTDKISTIIGGGADTGNTVAGGTNLSMVAQNSNTNVWNAVVFSVLGNGDILFMSDYAGDTFFTPVNWRIRYYKSSEDKVYSLVVNTTTGPSSNSASFDSTACYAKNFVYDYDPETFALDHFEFRASGETSGIPSCSLTQRAEDGIALTVPSPLLDPGGAQITNQNVPSTQQPKLAGLQNQLYRLFTGKNGKPYLFNSTNGQLFLYDRVARTYTRIAGAASGGQGFCADGIQADSCPMQLTDAYVTREGRVYVMDRGKIRFIDENKNIQTLIGQDTLYHGDSALAARFATVTRLRYHSGTQELFFGDSINLYFRRATIGGTADFLYGGGALGSSSTPLPSYSSPSGGMTVEFYPGTSDLIFNQYGSSAITPYLYRRDHATGLWSVLTGAKPGTYTPNDGDGKSGDDINFNGAVSAFNTILKVVGNILYMQTSQVSSPASDLMVKAYDISDHFRQSHVIGVTGISASSTCTTEGQSTSTCNWTSSAYTGIRPEIAVDTNGDLLIPDPGTNRTIHRIHAGTRTTWLNIGQAFRGIAFDLPNDRIYYCGGDGTNYRIYSYVISTGVKTPIAGWPTAYDCEGLDLILDGSGAGKRVIFPVSRKGSGSLQGIAAFGNLP